MITADRSFSPTSEIEVQGDPGTWQEYTTLELTWFDDGIEMRINIYFASDGTDWWATEIRTYDGEVEGEWITTEGEFFRSSLGTPFSGDLRLDNLRLEDLQLEAFRTPEACQNPDGDLAIVVDAYTIYGSVGVGAGYATTLQVFETGSCEPVGSDNLRFEVTAGDPSVATVVESGVELDEGGDGAVRAELLFEAIGETTMRVEAIDTDSGELIDVIEVPIVVRELGAGGS